MASSLTLAIGSDHGGFALKAELIQYIQATRPEITVLDRGTTSAESVNYTDFAKMVVNDVLAHTGAVGILVCGTGIGMSMMANRYTGIRAALVTTPYMAEMTKAHNNANILCLGGRTTDVETAKTMLDKWLDTPFEGGRHLQRIQQLDELV